MTTTTATRLLWFSLAAGLAGLAVDSAALWALGIAGLVVVVRATWPREGI